MIDLASAYSDHGAVVRRLIGRRLPEADPALVDDLLADTFERAVRAGGRFNGGSVRAWLCMIAHHLCIDHLRRLRVARPVPLEAWPGVTSDAGADRHLDLIALRDSLAALPDAEQAFLLAHYRDGRTLGDAGDCSKTAGSRRHTRALAALRSSLEAGATMADMGRVSW